MATAKRVTKATKATAEPEITIQYGDVLVRFKIGVKNDGARLAALHAADLLARSAAHAHLHGTTPAAWIKTSLGRDDLQFVQRLDVMTIEARG